MNKILKLFVIILLSASCNGRSPQNVSEQNKRNVEETPTKTSLCTVHVYFFDNFPATLGHLMIDELKKVYPIVKFEGNLALSDAAYYAPRKRYLAPKLLDTMLALQPNKDKVLGFTTQDISLKYKNHENWGVMGLSYLNKRACVLSTFRLKKASILNEHLKKLMLHEMGHVEGLPHCKNDEHCIMRDAEGKNRFSELNDFCPSCKAYLKQKGWKLNG